MQDRMKINDEVTVGPQPSTEEIGQLRDEGFQTVANFRVGGEDDQPLPPQEEGDQVQAAGMEYYHNPVSPDSLSPAVVDEFRQAYANLPKPMFAHCKGGKRAGAMVMMHLACEQGLSGEQTLRQAEELGFECDQPELVDFVTAYVDSHGRQE